MKLNNIFKWGMLALIVISVILLIWGSAVGFESNGGAPVDILLRWAYIMVGIAVFCWIAIGLYIGIKNDPKSLVKLGVGIAAAAVLALISFIFAKGAPAMGMLVQPDASTLKLTDTILNLTYIVGAGAIIAIIAGEIRLAILNKK